MTSLVDVISALRQTIEDLNKRITILEDEVYRNKEEESEQEIDEGPEPVNDGQPDFAKEYEPYEPNVYDEMDAGDSGDGF